MSRWRESSGVSSGSTIVPPAESSCGNVCESLQKFSKSSIDALRRTAPSRTNGGPYTDGERHVVAADVERVLRVPRLHVELARRLRDLLEHEVRIELDELAVDLLAGLRERLHRLREQELDSELGDDPPPAAVERRDGILGEDLVAGHPVHEHVGGS